MLSIPNITKISAPAERRGRAHISARKLIIIVARGQPDQVLHLFLVLQIIIFLAITILPLIHLELFETHFQNGVLW